MFKEKVSIYPHPSALLEPSRNSVLFLLFKVAFSSLIEEARFHSFSGDGYRQLQVDTEFLKYMIPHYISSDCNLEGVDACSSLLNLLSDTMAAIGERCTDEASLVENDDVLVDSLDTVRAFAERVNSGEENAEKFVINDD